MGFSLSCRSVFFDLLGIPVDQDAAQLIESIRPRANPSTDEARQIRVVRFGIQPIVCPEDDAKTQLDGLRQLGHFSVEVGRLEKLGFGFHLVCSIRFRFPTKR